jgi:hypothetical protein
MGREPYYPAGLQENLNYLQEFSDFPMLQKRPGVGGPEWVVDPDVRRVVLKQLSASPSWISGVSTFWATYLGERLGDATASPEPDRKEGQDDGELRVSPPRRRFDALVELC